ncbi:ubiquitin-like modifier-activating enzyme ATG7 [Sycon ciliatum]|uniref:ubiquitin-like modifier-activating enzyme ATG7 n=1 Tax=Sycon ciliatum TaxID=27933 RepID=UPI0020A87194|eukprot:scpid38577/ scgid34106/ Ubiquitin-like modifier-activating enzyme ATG7; ATG12-activating enzyme E1 ATG7; Autophagy-related protein 7
MASLQFAPFSSALNHGFWHVLTRKKLEEFRLSDEARVIHGSYSNGDQQGLPCRMSIDFDAFESDGSVPRRASVAPGMLLLKNTMDDFKSADKKKIIEEAGKQIWDDIQSGAVLENPSLLSRFALLTFADLKKYYYYFWFAFPALAAEEGTFESDTPKKLVDVYSPDQIVALQSSVDALINAGKGVQHSYFVIRSSGDTSLEADLLSNWESAIVDGCLTVGFCDPCTLELNPGWPMRNLLALALAKWRDTVTVLRVVCFRDRTREGKRETSHSLVINLKLAKLDQDSTATECPKVVGWEKNERGKLGPRMVNLSTSMDPARLAESAVDLNLKLMRWRLLPSLNLEKIASTRCLLLGSGTLGCNVARSLLAWGVRQITFVDNGKVSYSNPVRQTLFTFEDCINGGKPKAQTAAERLKQIFPGVQTKGVSLSVPMPGHAVAAGQDEEQVRKDVQILEQLIDEHDVVFLLMDTRESRWLPTVVAASKGKLVMNAALGFDTYVVLRHGFRGPKPDKTAEDSGGAGSAATNLSAAEQALSGKLISGGDLGCYFCNDVVAPGNSTRDRTLDQQCTVTRPGVSMIASALAVELMVSVLQHPDGGHAAADSSANEGHLEAPLTSALGLVPHQIRGFLSRYQTVLPPSIAFSKCTGCSPLVVQRYEAEGFSFLLNAFNSPTFLEDVTGLTELHKETMDAEVWEVSDDDDF